MGEGREWKGEKKWRAKRAERESGEVPFPSLPSPPPDCFVDHFFFHRFIRFLPFYPITVTEPDSRLIKRCFESGATGENTSSIRGGGGGGGEGGAVRDIKDYERRIYLIISETEG